jgi:fermentation-respiration switch protein FrsA (DUF1100 family)
LNLKRNHPLRFLASNAWLRAGGLVVLVGAMGCLFYPWIENFFAFCPDRSFEATPAHWGLAAEDVYFESADGTRLHGWFFPGPHKAPMILFSHGNGGNVSHRLENVGLLLDRGLRVFIYDYRGYGKSSGRPSEDGIYQDAVAAYDYLVSHKQISPSHIISFGRSLGACAAIEVARKRKIRSLIIESAFTSTKEMAKQMLVFRLLSPCLPTHFNNLGKIREVHVPKLMIHGDADEVVPFSMGERLYAAAPDPKRFYSIPGAGHNDTYMVGGNAYFDAFERFARDSSL